MVDEYKAIHYRSRKMEPWLQLVHPSQSEDKWWITSNNLSQLEEHSIEAIFQRTDIRAVVAMHDCNSQGREYLRCFTWLNGDDTRYLNILTANSRNYVQSYRNAQSLFGDSDFWLILPTVKCEVVVIG